MTSFRFCRAPTLLAKRGTRGKPRYVREERPVLVPPGYPGLPSWRYVPRRLLSEEDVHGSKDQAKDASLRAESVRSRYEVPTL